MLVVFEWTIMILMTLMFIAFGVLGLMVLIKTMIDILKGDKR